MFNEITEQKHLSLFSIIYIFALCPNVLHPQLSEAPLNGSATMVSVLLRSYKILLLDAQKQLSAVTE